MRAGTAADAADLVGDAVLMAGADEMGGSSWKMYRHFRRVEGSAFCTRLSTSS